MIREAGQDDVEHIANLAVMLWSGQVVQDLMEEFSEIIYRGDVRFFLKYDQDMPVGFAQCQLRHDYVEGTATSCWILRGDFC
ncbi:putative aminoglycoside N6-acetyltransferase [Listeria grandensis FSL F6-0971]|uniref:Putative aminoglycoside N6-acetyltransferase n=1 Tax=Listeria grandensis FSL F6-0971 TaxID=1265819 RepID=W7BQK5_9LIST|nr:putative aminoglycoside N6-acetyltransferase [Listeria grandensis FSL F6-0971]